MTTSAGFTAATFSFLDDLAGNNTREWFEAHRDRYLRDLVEPSQRFILAVGEELERLSPSLRADPRRVGGSMFRIHRDLRFSNDKTPYKTHAGIQFRHASGKDAHAPGLYVHVEPGNCFVGLGVWRPAAAPLRAIRTALVDGPERWLAAVDVLVQGGFVLSGDSLKRVPRGFDGEHPLADDLKRKDFIGVAELERGRVVAPDFAHDVVESALAGQPLLHFLCDALEVPR